MNLLLALLVGVPAPASPPDRVDLEVANTDSVPVPAGLEMRVRVAAMDPAGAYPVEWKFGGAGIKGKRHRGSFPSRRGAPDLPMKQWSAWVPVSEIIEGEAPPVWFLTLTLGPRNRFIGNGPYGEREFEGGASSVELDIEFRHGTRVLKRLRAVGESGPTTAVVVRFHRLAEGGPRSGGFVDGISTLLDHASQRYEYARRLPWARKPKPERYAIVTTLHGYGEGKYHGIRHSSPHILEAEALTLGALGFNGLQGATGLLPEQLAQGFGVGTAFGRGAELYVPGYPTPSANQKQAGADAGCAYHPNVTARQRSDIEKMLEIARSREVQTFWGITEDEIGAVVDKAHEKKPHLTRCPHCQEGYRGFLRSEGVRPRDLGAKDWASVAPLDIWSIPRNTYADGLVFPWMEDEHARVGAYWTRRFINHASAQLFTPMRDAVRAANAAKKPGDPEIQVGAMRGNTFLMRGQSLDFFNWYRLADTFFLYETSNRDRRVLQWDSYLLDVGRTVSEARDLELGILVKPHRGAGEQRALSAVARGASWINWYTYGPEYAKGDSWASRPEIVAEVQRTNARIASAEHVTYGSTWAEQPRVAMVKPRASEFWMYLAGRPPLWTAAWENAKWMHTAYSHAHIPVDPIDQVAITEGALERYDVLVVNGPAMERAAVAKLEPWVRAGGTLVTTGYGLSRDEYDQPLDLSLLGLRDRKTPEMWRQVAAYRSTKLAPMKPLTAGDTSIEWKGREVPIRVGREVLVPARGTTVLARFADGAAAVTERRVGAGRVVVYGYFPGLEYAAPLYTPSWNLSRDLNANTLDLAMLGAEGVRPVVDVSLPTVEAVLVQNPDTGARAVVVMNWAYRRTGKAFPELVVAKRVKLTLRGKAPRRVRDSLTGQRLEVRNVKGGFEVLIPTLDAGAILLLE